jgi:hypothetical protein
MTKAKTETPHNTWKCAPKLRKAVDVIDKLAPLMIEIRHLPRAHYLDHMVVEMKWKLLKALDILDAIDTSEEFTTVEDNYNWNEDNHDEPDFDFHHYDRYAD